MHSIVRVGSRSQIMGPNWDFVASRMRINEAKGGGDRSSGDSNPSGLVDNVGMLAQFAPATAHRYKDDPYPFAPHELESWNEIGVACDHDHSTNHVAQRQSRHIHANPHVDSLLLEVRHEIGVD